MLNYLNDIDTTALLAINGWHGTFMDALWWLVSAKWASALLVLELAWILLRQNRRHALLVLAGLVLSFALADQLSSGLIKHTVERLRPARDPAIAHIVHVVNGYRGGMYGFVSSHAANSFAASMFVALIARQRLITLSLFIWALLQCYSRVYLGVHYPGDIIGGMVIGLLVGWLVYWLTGLVQRRWAIPAGHYTRTHAVGMASALALTAVSLTIAAALT